MKTLSETAFEVVFLKSNNLFFDNEIPMSPIVPLNHYFSLKNEKIRSKSIPLFHAHVLKQWSALVQEPEGWLCQRFRN